MIDDYQSSGWINQWTIIDGEARCFDDAIPPTDPEAATSLGRNAVVRFLLAVETLPAADEIEALLKDPKPIKPTSEVPAMVSDRQFFHACARAGLITQNEALAAVRTGDLPVMLQDIVDLIPPPYEFDVRMALQGSNEFRRSHPFVEMIARSLGWSEEQVDDLFRMAGKL